MIEPNESPGRLEDMEATLTRTTVGQPRLEANVHVAAPSFDAFYTAVYDDVARALSITLGDAGWGQEAADEAMTRAYDRWSDVSTYTNPAGWVYRVGVNWARSWHRKLNRRMPWASDEISLTPTKDHALDAALLTLDVKYRAVVVCRYLLDWSNDETARALDIAPGTVKSRLSTGLAQLRSQLDLPVESPTSEQDAS